MSAKVKPWKRAQVLGTRGHLLAPAAPLFGARGYGATALEEIVSHAGLTRGAVYHHFKDKRALFDAVVDQTLLHFVDQVERRGIERALERGAPREADAIELFVEHLCDGPRRRILCLDAPSVLGRARWNERMWARLLDPLRRIVESGAERGRVEADLVPVLTHLLFGAVQEAALLAAGGRERVEGVNSSQPAVERSDIDDPRQLGKQGGRHKSAGQTPSGRVAEQTSVEDGESDRNAEQPGCQQGFAHFDRPFIGPRA